MKRPNQHLHYFGAKYLLAPELVKLFPKRFRLYCEVFAGSLAVLMCKEPGLEVVNDYNGDVANLYRVLRHALLGEKLPDLIEFTPYSYEEYCAAVGSLDHGPAGEPDVERARLFLTACNQAIKGKPQRPSDWSVEKKGQRNGTARTTSVWNSLPEALRCVARRIKNAQIENKHWRDILKKYDAPDTFFYQDPPYLHCTRKQKNGYALEMTDDDHREFLAAVKGLKGLVMISGKACDLYDTELARWRHKTFKCRQRGNPEVVWMNYRRGKKFI